MSDAVQLFFDRLIDFFLSMSVDIAPERRNAVQVLPTLDIDQVMAVAPADNAWLFAHPLLHLRERVPKITVVELP